MSWIEFFQNATRAVGKKINSKAMIVNFAPEYFVNLTKIVQEYNKTTSGKMYVYPQGASDMAHLLRNENIKNQIDLPFYITD